MKKFFTALSIASAFWANAQINLKLDTSFGNNGIVRIPLQGNGDDLHMLLSQDNKLLAYGSEDDTITSNSINRIYKYNLDGSPDTTFGNNGAIVLPNYSSFYNPVLQGTDKFLVYYQPNNLTVHILRYNLNGTLDTSFASNGEFIYSIKGSGTSGGFLQDQLIVLNDSSILFCPGTEFVKLTPDGQLDNNYGANGTLILNSGHIDIKYNGNSIISGNSSKIQNIDLTGQPINSFGANSFFDYNNSGDYVLKLNPNGEINSMEIGGDFYRLTSNGTLINKFTLPSGNENHDYTLQGDYTVFTGITGSISKPFIQYYDRNNQVQTINGQNIYNENLTAVYNCILNINNNLYTSGLEIANNQSSYILAKYIYSNSLSTTEANLSQFAIANPVGNTLNYQTKEAVKEIALYNAEGRLVKSISTNNAEVSDLPKGVYVAKITFKNGQTTTKKIIKK